MEGVPVEVLVSLDDVSPPKVRHEGILVSVSETNLAVVAEACNFDELDRARSIAANSIATLPSTPLDACGFNIRYRSEALPESLIRRFSMDLDRRFSEHGFEIVGRKFQRILKKDAGTITVIVAQDPDSNVELLINFELKSHSSEELIAWLSTPMEGVRTAVDTIIRQSLELDEGHYIVQNCDDAQSGPE